MVITSSLATIQKTADDGGTIQLTIEEDGKRIFETKKSPIKRSFTKRNNEHSNMRIGCNAANAV